MGKRSAGELGRPMREGSTEARGSQIQTHLHNRSFSLHPSDGRSGDGHHAG